MGGSYKINTNGSAITINGEFLTNHLQEIITEAKQIASGMCPSCEVRKVKYACLYNSSSCDIVFRCGECAKITYHKVELPKV